MKGLTKLMLTRQSKAAVEGGRVPNDADGANNQVAELQAKLSNVSRLLEETRVELEETRVELAETRLELAARPAKKGPEADAVSPSAIGLVEASRPANAGGTALALTKPSLADAVMDWQRNRPAATKDGGAAAQELHTKFAASSESFTYTYEGVDMFYGGLARLIGAPSSDV